MYHSLTLNVGVDTKLVYRGKVGKFDIVNDVMMYLQIRKRVFFKVNDLLRKGICFCITNNFFKSD
jgi:hypothetical protein